jgi:hypothetical protein
VPRNKEEHGTNPTRESTDEHCILDANPVLAELLATAVRESTAKLCTSSAISTITISMAAITAILPSVPSDIVDPAATAHSGNLATASRKLIKASVKFGTSELQSIATRSGLSCQSQADLLWNSKQRSSETITSDL